MTEVDRASGPLAAVSDLVIALENRGRDAPRAKPGPVCLGGIALVRDHPLGADPRAAVAEAAAAAAEAALRGLDVFVDTTRYADVGAVPDRLNPRGRIVLVAGRGPVAFDLWRFYVREIQLLGS
jgi:hypothetical protein